MTRSITLFQAYTQTAVYTAEALGMQHDGKPVMEIAFSGNNFYQVIYVDNSSRIVFSPDSERPITVAHLRAPRRWQRCAAPARARSIHAPGTSTPASERASRTRSY